MKNRIVAIALLLGAIVSVTSGCVVRGGGYGHDRHHDNGRDHHYHDYNRGY